MTPPEAPHEPVPPTPAGVFVIASVFALGALASFALLSVGTENGRTFGAVSGVVCAFLAHGLATRKNLVRLLAQGLLGLSVLVTLLLVLYLLAGAAGLVPLAANVQVGPRVVRAAVSAGLTVWMLTYLRRADVRAAFLAKRPRPQPTRGEETRPGE